LHLLLALSEQSHLLLSTHQWSEPFRDRDLELALGGPLLEDLADRHRLGGIL
jgi:hypothetical protein